MPAVKAIVGMTQEHVIGIENELPWHIPADMKRFKDLTTGHTVLMGRKTYESLPAKFRPLPGRKNIVVSRTWDENNVPENVLVVSDPERCIRQVKEGSLSIQGDTLWVIGGQKIYENTLELCDELYLTRILSRYSGDAFFPKFESDFQQLAIEEFDGYSFEHFVRK